jgi:hypothetical protein
VQLRPTFEAKRSTSSIVVERLQPGTVRITTSRRKLIVRIAIDLALSV